MSLVSLSDPVLESRQSRLVIGLTGLAGSGKSTAARYMAKHYGFEVWSFAANLKKACQIIFDLSDSQLHSRVGKELVDPRWGLSPREIFQKFGTEVGREFMQGLWIKSLECSLERSGGNRIVIDDLRFLDEADFVKSLGGKVVGIRRDVDLMDHESEKSVVKNWQEMIDLELNNNDDLSYLQLRIDWFLGTLGLSPELNTPKPIT